MKKRLLNNNWQLRRIADNSFYDTKIPSSVLSVLRDYSIIPDPYYRDNEDLVRPFMDEDYEYHCVFDVDADIRQSELVLLRFDGIDTIADVYLNGHFLGRTDNMHRTWEFSAGSYLLSDQNQLRLVLQSPFRFAEEEYRRQPVQGTADAWEGFSHVRKAHYMYGWDWGAHLPDAGLFRDVSLIAVDKARIDSVYILQTHHEEKVLLSFRPLFNLTGSWQQESELQLPGAGYHMSLTITDPDGQDSFYDNLPETLEIVDPLLWWPNNLGSQPLYQISCSLFFEDRIIDNWQCKIGLRTLGISRKADEWGESFAHEINGQTIFAMGADYIPEEHLLSDKNPGKTRQLLEDCVRANFNCIRVWGGGYYPDDHFFNLCDELGLIVWQDFMFACSAYVLTPEFEQNITAEFIDNIKRIRHHASLGLWCGNNEMENFVMEGQWISRKTEVRDYLIMYERIIPRILAQYDPASFYWPSSPSSGGSFDDPQSPNRGDVHYWDVWHGNKPFSEYRKFRFRYLSEFGFQSLPSFETIKEGISDDPRDHNLFSYIMEKHQRNGSANGKIMNYLQQTYRYPGSFAELIYASALLQADAIRYGVEHFRRHRGECMGAVYWQLNDCWPVISWSSIDYFGRWKALHYYAGRFFAPVLISCEEQSWLTAGADFNRQHFEFEKSIRLNVTNETFAQKELIVRWAVRRSDGSIIRQEDQKLTVQAMSSVWLDKTELPELDPLRQYVSYEALENKIVISCGTVLFSYPKYFEFANPQLRLQVAGDEIIVEAAAYARSVEIANANDDLVLSDNYFDINSGIKRVKILRGSTEGLKLRSARDIGR